MAGSPKYLELLDEVASYPHVPTTDWPDLDEAWNKLTEKPRSTSRLEDLADICFDLISIETGSTRQATLTEARTLHIAKNAGYAGADNPDPWANFRLSSTFDIDPIDGVLVRMSDKYIRITNLRRDAANDRVGESIIDTLRDLAAYALIAICLIEEQNGMAA